MTVKEPTELPKSDEMSSASRRDFMKVAGIGALGLAYTSPIVETLHGGSRLTNYDRPKDGGSSSSSGRHSEPSSSNPDNPSSSNPGPSSSSLPNG